MLLKNKVTRRKFTISNDNLNYLTKLLSHDIETELSQYLIEKEKLSSLECSDLAKKIIFCLKNFDIFEYNQDGKLIPIINPSLNETNSEYILNPISNQKQKFLTLLSNCLLETGEKEVFN